MPKLVGLVAVTMMVILVVAYWTHRGSRDHDRDEQFAPREVASPSRPRSTQAPSGSKPGTKRPARSSAANSRLHPAAASGGNGKRPARPGPSRTGPTSIRPTGTRSTGTRPAGESAAARHPAKQERLAPPDGAGTQRQGQGDDVAKRRFGIGERVGWLRRNDVDSEMWPEESFGGVSDEQFWDDLSSDKPLASTARTAHSDSEPAARPEPRAGRPGQARLGPSRGAAQGPSPASRAADRPGDRTAAQPVLQSGTQPPHSQATQAFPAAAQLPSGPRTGPLPAYTGQQPAYAGPDSAYTGPQPAYAGPDSAYTGPLAAYTGPQPAYTGPQPAYTGPQPAYSGPQPAYTGSQPVQAAPSGGPQPARAARPGNPPQSYARTQQAAPAQAQPPAQSMPPSQGLPAIKAPHGPGQTGSAGSRPPAGQPTSRGRHSSGDDPLTSEKFSLRAATDGRSYQASRRPRDLTREQYETALSQETQTFSLSGTDVSSGAYPAQPVQANARPRRRHAADRPSGSAADAYGTDVRDRDGNRAGGHQFPYSQQPGDQTPSYGNGYGADGSRNGSGSDARGGRGGEPRSARDAVTQAPVIRNPVTRDPVTRDPAPRDGSRRAARPVYPDRRGPYDLPGGSGR